MTWVDPGKTVIYTNNMLMSISVYIHSPQWKKKFFLMMMIYIQTNFDTPITESIPDESSITTATTTMAITNSSSQLFTKGYFIIPTTINSERIIKCTLCRYVHFIESKG